MIQPADWLGPFIEGEVRAVIAWKTAPRVVKPDPDVRFGDDGSNLHSTAAASLLPPNSAVQITTVISADAPVTVLVTDGYTQTRAVLRGDAVAALESGTAQKFDPNMAGEIFAIREMSVTSTPYGPSDHFFQLSVQNIEYMYHLRRAIGQPKPVEERPVLGRLLLEIMDLLHGTYLPEDGRESRIGDTVAGGPSVQSSELVSSQNDDASPQSQTSNPVARVTSQTVVEQSPGTQCAVATQITGRQRQKGPALSRDGFEQEEGVNLAFPVEASIKHGATRLTALSTTAQPAMGKDNSAKLLSLLGKRKAGPAASARQRAVSPTSKDLRTNAAVSPQENRQMHLLLERTPPLSHVQQPPQRSVVALSQSRDYWRKKIPSDQQKLLEQPSAWVPSLPGQRFPHPNLPVELLKAWNTQVVANLSPAVTSRAKLPRGEDPISAPAAHVSSDGSSNAGSSDESSEDEEISASQWPPTPVRKASGLPPDSTLGSRPVSPAFHRNNDHTRPSSSRSTAGLFRHPPPRTRGDFYRPMPSQHRSEQNQEDLRSSPRPYPSSLHSPTVSNHGREARRYSPMSTESSRRRFPSSRPYDSPSDRSARIPLDGAGRGKTSRLPSDSPDNGKGGQSTRSMSRDGLADVDATSVVAATQLSIQHEDVDIEMSIPRAVPNPAQEHHRRRRVYHEGVRREQRRNWIKEHYIGGDVQRESFTTAFTTYKAANPRDNVRPSQFAEAMEELVPILQTSSLRTTFDLQNTELEPPGLALNNDLQMRHPSSSEISNVAGIDDESGVQVDVPASSPADVGTQQTGNSSHIAVRPDHSSSLHQTQEPKSTPGRRLPWRISQDAKKVSSSTSAQKSLPAAEAFNRHHATGRPRSQPIPSLQQAKATSSPLTVSRPTTTNHPSTPPQLPNQQRQPLAPPPATLPTHASSQKQPHPSTNPAPPILPSASITSEPERSTPDRTNPSPFPEFARSWTRLAPGGAAAVATVNFAGEQKRFKRRQLDVWAWEL